MFIFRQARRNRRAQERINLTTRCSDCLSGRAYSKLVKTAVFAERQNEAVVEGARQPPLTEQFEPFGSLIVPTLSRRADGRRLRERPISPFASDRPLERP